MAKISIPAIKRDPLGAAKQKLYDAQAYIDEYKNECSKETAWSLRKLYNNLIKRTKYDCNSMEGGALKQKWQKSGYQSAMWCARQEFAAMVAELLKINPSFDKYGYENLAVGELIRLAKAYDHMAAFKCAEDLGDWWFTLSQV